VSLPQTGKGGRPGPLRAALLSFIWPGLGHFALRNRRAALVFAAPVFVLLLAVLAMLAARGVTGFSLMLLGPAVALTVVVVVASVGLWRLLAVGDSVRRAGPAAAGKRAITAFGVGVVVEPPFELEPESVDVRWPAGRCFEAVDGLLPVPAGP